jgi:hypothetical protein
MTKQRLEEILWEMSIAKFAEKYGVHHSLVTDLCKKWYIYLPPLGYWRRKMFFG